MVIDVAQVVNDGSVSVIAGGVLGFVSQLIQNKREIKQTELEINERKNARDHEHKMTQAVPNRIPKKLEKPLPIEAKRDLTKPLIAFYTLGLLTYILFSIMNRIDGLEIQQVFEVLLIILNIISFIIGKSIGWFFGAKQKR